MKGQSSLFILLGSFPNLSRLMHSFDISLLSCVYMRFSFFSLLHYHVMSLGIEGNHNNTLVLHNVLGRNCERIEPKVQILQCFYLHVLLPCFCSHRMLTRLLLCKSALCHFKTHLFTYSEFIIILMMSASIIHAWELMLPSYHATQRIRLR